MFCQARREAHLPSERTSLPQSPPGSSLRFQRLWPVYNSAIWRLTGNAWRLCARRHSARTAITRVLQMPASRQHCDSSRDGYPEGRSRDIIRHSSHQRAPAAPGQKCSFSHDPARNRHPLHSSSLLFQEYSEAGSHFMEKGAFSTHDVSLHTRALDDWPAPVASDQGTGRLPQKTGDAGLCPLPRSWPIPRSFSPGC